ncbi:MAG: HD domain-containing protein [archaeon]
MDITEKINSSKIVAEAYLLAFNAHSGQKRKSGENYFMHPLQVAVIAIDNNADDAIVAASLLHDVVEDTVITLDEIRSKFGEEVCFLVDGVTKEKSDEGTFNKIRMYSQKDKRVLFVKLADRIHNMQTPIDSDEWKKKYCSSTKEFYIPMAREYGFENFADRLENLLGKLKNAE